MPTQYDVKYAPGAKRPPVGVILGSLQKERATETVSADFVAVALKTTCRSGLIKMTC